MLTGEAGKFWLNKIGEGLSGGSEVFIQKNVFIVTEVQQNDTEIVPVPHYMKLLVTPFQVHTPDMKPRKKFCRTLKISSVQFRGSSPIVRALHTRQRKSFETTALEQKKNISVQKAGINPLLVEEIAANGYINHSKSKK